MCTICIDVKLQFYAGGQQPIFPCCPTKLPKMWWMGSWTHEPVPALYVESRPWAHISRSWGGHILLIAVGFIRSLSTVIILLYIYIYIYIYILYYCIRFHSSCRSLLLLLLLLFCMHGTFHFNNSKSNSEQVCVCAKV